MYLEKSAKYVRAKTDEYAWISFEMTSYISDIAYETTDVPANKSQKHVESTFRDRTASSISAKISRFAPMYFKKWGICSTFLIFI